MLLSLLFLSLLLLLLLLLLIILLVGIKNTSTTVQVFRKRQIKGNPQKLETAIYKNTNRGGLNSLQEL